jgi:DMSO reductase anchor subunit
LATVFSTGMIYACLKTIPNWNTSLTPANYLMLGLMLGSLVLTSLRLYRGEAVEQILVMNGGFLITAGIMKALYYFWVGKPSGPTINTATSFNRATVRLFDVGHSAGTFLTDEFGYHTAHGRLRLLRWAVYAFAFVSPGLLIALGKTLPYVMGAMAIALTGVFIERWLFFAEARHVVTLYHGRQQV